MAIKEGLWDCPTCQTKGILGRYRECDNCGAPRPEGVRFYLPQNAPNVTNTEQLAIAKAGADWICEYCGASNRVKEENCVECSAPKSEITQAVKEYSTANIPRSPKAQTLPRQKRMPSSSIPTAVVRSSMSTKKGKGRGYKWWLGIIAIAASVVVGLAIFLFRPITVEATVSGLSWERKVTIEKLTTVTESDWSIPAGGRLLSQREEIRRYKQVLDHYETKTRQVSEQVKTGTESYNCGTRDLGNGYFETKTCTRDVYETRTKTETYDDPIYRDEPIYETKYTYEIDRWLRDRVEVASGVTKQTYWPDFVLNAKEREGGRSQDYKVYFTGEKGESYTLELDPDFWSTFDPGESQILKVNRLGGVKLAE
ncbi:zinc finger protein [Spirulina sp. 06S082]|uniref:zinc finger protein n=1 Tax=Spirulina sp. 06S082 TaxID=3110248 RepID=UPI002B219AE2|nr:zinc finger protein [Spirulina sp. 06S082]MEA5471529.1 zinc finger protein [Spirulina sp. 06S082]